MPKMNVKVPHSLGEEIALERVKSLLSNMKQEYGNQIQNLQESWNENAGKFSFSAMGFSISGELKVASNQVELNGKLPLAALPFKGSIEKSIRQKANELLR